MTSLSMFTPPLTPPEHIQAVVELLRHIAQMFRKESLTFWAISATLLGAVRAGNMLPWYDDADLSITLPSLERLLTVVDISSYGLAIRRLPDRWRMCWNNNNNNYPFVDLFPCFVDVKHIVKYTDRIANQSLPNEWFYQKELFPLVDWPFTDFYLPGPVHPYRYLAANFGEKWRTRARTNGYINSTQTRVPVVEFDYCLSYANSQITPQ